VPDRSKLVEMFNSITDIDIELKTCHIGKCGAQISHVKAIFGEIDHQHTKDTDNASMLLWKISSIKRKKYRFMPFKASQ